MENIEQALQALDEVRAFLVKQLPPAPGLCDLAQSDQWPQAIDPTELADEDSVDSLLIRADTIIGFLLPDDLVGKKILDFGCGNGLVASRCADNGATAVGYDVNPITLDYGFSPSVVLTQDLGVVAEKAPFDIVILYDVLDHAVGATPVDLLKQIKQFASDQTQIVVRTHPWTSPHATHLCKKLNKAYLHLVFSDAELAGMGLANQPTLKVIHPLSEYRKWFADAGLTVVQETAATDRVPDFFAQNKAVAAKIKSHFKQSPYANLASGRDFPTQQLGIHFVDYLLKI